MKRRHSGSALAALLVLTAATPAVAAAPGNDPARAQAELQAILRAAPDAAHGQHLFAICQECHGPKGEGNASGWPPQIAGQHPQVIAKELVDFRLGLRRYDPMSRIAGRHILHDAQDIADVAAYVSTLKPVPEAAPGGSKPEQGAGLYAAQCTGCHGAQGEGNGANLVPRVAGQRYEYLLRQLGDAREGRRADMQDQHRAVLRGYSMQQLQSLAAYMTTLGH